jgi:3-deoxy-D-manno-octulosonic-acid transferase
MSALSLYRFATIAGGLPIRQYLRRRMARGKEDPVRFAERMGEASASRPAGPLVWLHAASVGEAMSVLTLIRRISEYRRDLTLLVTTGTVTSAQLMAERLPAHAIHQFVPVDRPAWVRRFLDHWRPDLAVWVESELWPNLLEETRARGIPAVLLNARMSARSHRNWRRLPSMARRLLGAFHLCLTQDETMAERLRDLGAANVKTVGNLKYGADRLPCREDGLAQLRDAVGDRPLWLAASTHPGEEERVAEAHEALANQRHALLTILVPRHPERGDEVADLLRQRGLQVARRSAGESPDSKTDIYLADTLGELGLFYRLSPVAFLGGSLVPVGGHNPIEPARLGCAVVFGPDMTNFAAISALLLEEQAAVQVPDVAALAHTVDHLLDRPEDRRVLAERGRELAEREAGVLDRVLNELAPFLESLGKKDARDARA